MSNWGWAISLLCMQQFFTLWRHCLFTYSCIIQERRENVKDWVKSPSSLDICPSRSKQNKPGGKKIKMFTVFKTKKYWGNIIKSATCFAEIVFEKIQSLPACVGDTFSSHKYAKGFPMALDLLYLWTVCSMNLKQAGGKSLIWIALKFQKAKVVLDLSERTW